LEGGLGCHFVAGLKQVRDVVGTLGPDRNLALSRFGGVGDRGQWFVIDFDQLSGILRLLQCLGHDKGDWLADITHGALRQAGKGTGEHRRSVRPLALERDAHHAELGRDEVVAGHDQRDAGRGLGCREIELADMGMRVWRTQHVSVCLAMQIIVALKAAAAGQETLVLETPHRLSDSELAHYLTRSPWWQKDPCSASPYNCATPARAQSSSCCRVSWRTSLAAVLLWLFAGTAAGAQTGPGGYDSAAPKPNADRV
jgi:hypothetical protein